MIITIRVSIIINGNQTGLSQRAPFSPYLLIPPSLVIETFIIPLHPNRPENAGRNSKCVVFNVHYSLVKLLRPDLFNEGAEKQ